MANVRMEVNATMPGATLLQTMRAVHSTSNLLRCCDPTKPVFLVRRSSKNETLKFEQSKAATFEQECQGAFKESAVSSPNAKSSESGLDDDAAEKDKTTITLHNLPVGLSRNLLFKALGALGIEKLVNFVYVPFDYKSGTFRGWAHINFALAASAKDCFEMLNGFCDWGIPSESPCEVSWCKTHQGLEELIEHYRNCSTMHDKIQDRFKPAMFKDGIRVGFPRPTRKIKRHFHTVCRQPVEPFDEDDMVLTM